MRLFSEKVIPTFTNSDLNILTVRDYNEVFFDVFEFEINGSKVIAEKIDTYKGMPIVSIPVSIDGQQAEYPFVLEKGKFGVIFNQANTLITPTQQEPVLESLEIDTGDSYEELVFENKQDILKEIRKAKQSAKLYIEQLKKQKLEEINQYNKTKSQQAVKELEAMKQSMLDDFLQLVESVRADLNDTKERDRVQLSKKITRSVQKIIQTVEEKTDNVEEKLEIKLHESIRKLLIQEAAKEKHANQELIQSKTKEISSILKEELETYKKQIESTVAKDVRVLESANVELNDKIEKQTNRALSRIGNVKTILEQSLDKTRDTFKQATTHLEDQLTLAESRIREYYDDKIEKVAEIVSEESKQYVLSCIEESKQLLLQELNNIKVDVPNIIIEQKKGSQIVDLKGIKKELEKIIGTRFTNEIQALKRLIEMSSGGGSVAVQYANGGVMNGDLLVTGTLSAANFSGGGGGLTGEYLPLSGGLLTGNLAVSGSVNARAVYTSSDEFTDYSKTTIYKDTLSAGPNTSPTFTLDTDLELANCKFFITYTSPEKRSVVEAFVMRFNDTCQINVYSIIHSDNLSPLLSGMSCEQADNKLNIISTVTQDCRAVFNGIATYTDETPPVFITEDMNYVFETEQGSGVLFTIE